MVNNTYFPSTDSRSDRIGGRSYKSQHLYSLDRGKMNLYDFEANLVYRKIPE